MATPENVGVFNMAFSRWKFRHYFSIIDAKGKNIQVKCMLCHGAQCLSMSVVSNSNLMKHLSTVHSTTKLVCIDGDIAADIPAAADIRPGHDKKGHRDEAPPFKQQRLDFSAQKRLVTQTELNSVIGRYVVENMLPLSAVDSDSFRAIIAKIPKRGGAVSPCRKTFSNYIEAEYLKMNAELKNGFKELEYVCTTADIWTAHNKSYLGVTAHWIDPPSMERRKAALACRRFRGHHTYDTIATELHSIHSSYGISHKITSTVTDNGSNFIKAFRKYQPVQEGDESGDDEEEVTFMDINDVLQSSGGDDDDDGGVTIALPPHQRCASHTLNLVSCTDVDKWFLSRPEVKAIYRSSTAKCTALWNKASRSTVAAETVDDVIARKLLVPCSTRWNSYYDALARICEVPIIELNAISSRFGLKAITEREHQFIREYCIVMKPLTVALDILQGEDNCFHGTLLPTLETLMHKTLDQKSVLEILVDLPEAIVMLVIMAGTMLLAYYFEYTDTFPVHMQGFFCYDKTFSKPYPGPDNTSKIPPVIIYSLVTAVPTLTIFVGELCAFFTKAEGTQEKTIVSADCCYFNPLLRRMIRFLGVYTFGLFTTTIFANAGQVVTGNQTPHFLSACRPNYTALGCQSTMQYITERRACTGNPLVVMSARKSFPSKDAALSVYCALYTVMYITLVFKTKGTRLTKPTISLTLLCLAMVVGVVRVAEYRNHWADVLAGFFTGASIAVFLVILLSAIQKKVAKIVR